ncbi:helix-turn-helix domain-containing protein [Pseudonocardia xishanensis]|uniref:TetR/AcrR family transcriptional regulator n=1 Tax=Pseudonocardia xishanensis TaxID=630995 RepID=A0ABP8RP52_9PSEU
MSREEQILAAATRLFAERSFDGVGVDAIAADAGVTGSAIYRHFSSKDEILAALFDRLIDALLIRIGEPADDPDAEIDGLIAAHVEFSIAHPELTIIWGREQAALAHVYRANLQRRQRAYVDRWIQALDTRYPGLSRDELAAAVRATHALMTSDTSRPASTRRIAGLGPLLCSLAKAALAPLGDPPPARVAGSS